MNIPVPTDNIIPGLGPATSNTVSVASATMSAYQSLIKGPTANLMGNVDEGAEISDAAVLGYN
jgi:hypothetical protein